MIIWIVFPKILNVQAWPILEGNKRDYPRDASVIVYWFHVFVFVLGYLAFDFMYMQTLGLTMVYLKAINCGNLKSTLLQISIREWGYKYLQMGDEIYRNSGVQIYLQPNRINCNVKNVAMYNNKR